MSRAVTRSDSFKRAKTLPYASRVPRIPRPIGNGPIFDPTPASIKVRLRYCKQISLSYSPTTENVVFEKFPTNSPYSPGAVANDHALGFDTYKALYNKYRVINSHCEVTPINNQDKGILLITKNTQLIPNYTLATALEKKYTTWALPSQLRNGGKRSVSAYWSMGENPELRLEEYTAITAQPDEDVYFNVGYASYQTDQIICIVNLTYDVEFSDRKMVT